MNLGSTTSISIREQVREAASAVEVNRLDEPILGHKHVPPARDSRGASIQARGLTALTERNRERGRGACAPETAIIAATELV